VFGRRRKPITSARELATLIQQPTAENRDKKLTGLIISDTLAVFEAG